MPNSHPVLHLPKLLFDGPIDAALTIALAHGAGLSKDAPFMTQIASGLADRGLRVARLIFPIWIKLKKQGSDVHQIDRLYLCRLGGILLPKLVPKH